MARQLVYDIVKGKNTVDPALKKTKKSSDKLTKSIDKTGVSFGALSSFFAAGAILAGFTAVVREAVNLENAFIGLQSVAKNTGQDVRLVTEAAKELAADGLIPLTQVSGSLKNLLASGLDLDTSIKLLNSFKDAAAFNRQGQLALGDAIERGTQGFKNRLSVLVDNVGITKNLSQIEREFTRETGKSTQNLSEQQKSFILANGLIKEATLFQGDYNKLLKTFSGSLSKVSGEFKFLVAEVGQFVTKSEESRTSVQALGQIFRNIRFFIKGNREELNLFLERLTFLSPGILLIKKSLDVLKAAVTEDPFGDLGESVEKTTRRIALLENSIVRLESRKFLTEEQRSNIELNRKEVTKLKRELAATAKEALILRDRGILPTAESTKLSAVGDDPRVIRERKIKDLVNRIQSEAAVRQQEISEIEKENVNLGAEEALIALQEQQGLRKEIESLDAIERAANKIKSEKELTDIEKKFQQTRDTAFVEALKKQVAAESLSQKQRVSLEQKTSQARVNILSASANLAAAIGKSGSKEVFLIQKAAALAQVLVATNVAAAQALAVPPAPNFPLQRLAFIAGGINASAIAATTIKGFQGGGIVQGATSSGDQNVIRANAGELVLNREQQANLFEMANGRGNQEENQEPQADIVVEINGREIARAVREEGRNGFQIAG